MRNDYTLQYIHLYTSVGEIEELGRQDEFFRGYNLFFVSILNPDLVSPGIL